MKTDTIGKRHVFGTVTMGAKGQIVIPADARKIFGIKPGDSLFIAGDEDRGIIVLTEKQVAEQFTGLYGKEKE